MNTDGLSTQCSQTASGPCQGGTQGLLEARATTAPQRENGPVIQAHPSQRPPLPACPHPSATSECAWGQVGYFAGQSSDVFPYTLLDVFSVTALLAVPEPINTVSAWSHLIPHANGKLVCCDPVAMEYLSVVANVVIVSMHLK